MKRWVGVRALALPLVILASLVVAPSAFAGLTVSQSGSAVTVTGDGYYTKLAFAGGKQQLWGLQGTSLIAGTNCTVMTNQVIGEESGVDVAECATAPTSWTFTLNSAPNYFHYDASYESATEVTVYGGEGHDYLYAPPTANTRVKYFGNGSDDYLTGGPFGSGTEDGGDLLDGGPGEDYLSDGGGANDNLLGGTEDDTIYTGDTADGYDVIDGGPGSDLVDYGERTTAITVNLPGAGANAGETGALEDRVQNIENVYGAFDQPNTLTGNASANRLEGGSGADVIDGGGGADTLYGYSGNDGLTGGAGEDSIFGDSGQDTLHAADGEADVASCGADADTLADHDSGLDNLFGCEGFDDGGGGGGDGGTETTTTPTQTTTTPTQTTTTPTPSPTPNTPAVTQDAVNDALAGLAPGQTVAAGTQPSPDGSVTGTTANPSDGSNLAITGTVNGSLPAKRLTISKTTVVGTKKMTNLKRGLVRWTLKLNKKAAKAFKKKKKLKLTIKTVLTPKSGSPIVKTLKVTIKKGKARACYRAAGVGAHAAC